MDSLKKNIILKGLLTFSNYIIGFVTFPYITRVLGPNNFGLVNFALNTVDYFLLFATMGIATIGTREIASVKDDSERLNIVYSRVLGTNINFTLITLVIFYFCICLIPKLSENRELFYIGSIKIIFSAFTVEWLYTGLENFTYITIRSLFIRLIYVGSIFIFVNNPSDYYIYFVLTIGVVVINSLINFTYSTKYVKLSFTEFKSFKYTKQNIRLGVYAIMTSMYITFNVMYLGFVSSDVEVGYYSTAVKLYFIAVSLFSAFTSVMLPRISALSANNKVETVKRYILKSVNMVFLTALPIIIVSIYFAPEIISIMSGEGYEAAVLPMRILMPALILVWISQIIVFQGLLPNHKDKLLLRSAIIGGVLAIIINVTITPKLHACGAAITLLSCEMVVTLYYIICVKSNCLMILPNLKIIAYNIFLSFPYVIICTLCSNKLVGLKGLIVAVILCGCYFLLLNPKKKINKIASSKI